jgi:hypothetical protein
VAVVRALVRQLFDTGFVDTMKKRDKDLDYLLNNGLDATATVLKDGGPYKTEDESGASARAYGDDERRVYTLRVEVADGREPYELTGNWFIANFFRGREWIRWVEEGTKVPVKVGKDDPNEVAVDWDAFEAGGAKERIELSRAIRYAEHMESEHQRAEAQASKLADRLSKSGMISAESAAAMRQQVSQGSPSEPVPPAKASPREHLDWQLRNGVIDQATYDAILTNNPKL